MRVRTFYIGAFLFTSLKLDNGRVSLSLEIIDYVIFFSYNVVENEAHFVLECPLYNSIRDKIL